MMKPTRTQLAVVAVAGVIAAVTTVLAWPTLAGGGRFQGLDPAYRNAVPYPFDTGKVWLGDACAAQAFQASVPKPTWTNAGSAARLLVSAPERRLAGVLFDRCAGPAGAVAVREMSPELRFLVGRPAPAVTAATVQADILGGERAQLRCAQQPEPPVHGGPYMVFSPIRAAIRAIACPAISMPGPRSTTIAAPGATQAQTALSDAAALSPATLRTASVALGGTSAPGAGTPRTGHAL